MWIRISISLLILPKIPWKSHVSTIFSPKKKIDFAYSLYIVMTVIVNISKISRVRLHYDIIVTSYEDGWYFFLVSMERGDETQSYTFVANIWV